MLIPIVKKFLNSTMGTSNAKPLNEMLMDKLSTMNNELTTIINKGKQISEQRNYEITSYSSSNLSYKTTITTGLSFDIRNSSSEFVNISNLSCRISGVDTSGNKFSFNPIVIPLVDSNEFKIFIGETTYGIPDSTKWEYNIFCTITKFKK